MHADKIYEETTWDILKNGQSVSDRTGVGTTSVFGRQLRFDMRDGFPLLTTKKVFFKGIIYELLWFLSGDTNVKYLQDHGVKIWDDWADEGGDIGPGYGKQWIAWESTDGSLINQIAQVQESIRNNPTSRRHIVSAWNVGDIPRMRLPPCHLLFQFYVRGRFLDLQLYQRSIDWALGAPFNIASYSLLLHMMAQCTGYSPGQFVYTHGDLHIYNNHVNGLLEQTRRKPFDSPQLRLTHEVKDIFDFRFEDITLANYVSHPTIPFDIAV